jgi:hypothetical protein
MLTVVFLFLIAMFLISGVFISLEARRRRLGRSAVKPTPLTSNKPRVGRATPQDE